MTAAVDEQGAVARPRLHLSIPREAFAAMWGAAAPLAVELAAARLAQALDLLWMGRLGPSALAAVAAGAGLRWVFASLPLGLAVGGMAAVARHRGRHDAKAASSAVWQTLLAGALLATLLSMAGWALAPVLPRAIGLSDDVALQAAGYLRIVLPGLAPLALLPVLAALLRAAGGAVAARRALILAAGLTMAVEPPLVFGWGPLPALGVAGSALAAVLGPAAGVLVLLALLGRGYGCLQLRRTTPAWRPREMGRILIASAPYSLQLTLRALARAALLAILARFGSLALAGYAAADAVLLLALVPSYALAEAAAALAMRSRRQGRPAAAGRGVCAMGTLNLAYMAVAVAGALVLAPQAVALFCPAPRAVALGADMLRIAGLGYLGSSLGVIAARGLDVTGHVVPVAAVNLITLWGVEVPAALLLSRIQGPAGVWLALAFGAAANGILMSYHFRRGRGLPA
ncbi:MAG TPA: MATE family efflux transporter [Anaerolineae bacterium]|nr:MATE family efflux transporter [Anaerolineae bacterium]HOQ97738.1 MATE family efflux transporter [Anaerolineae bacterium]HPL27288.1 MATE family efflux transporter [Anaerolineae bacterium]